MEIAKLLFSQTKGIFFVWRRKNGTHLITFLRNKAGVSWQSQINHAITEGRMLALDLVGVSYWWIEIVIIHRKEKEGCQIINKPSISLLRLRKLPPHVHASTEKGVGAMRSEWIPFALGQMKRILQANA